MPCRWPTILCSFAPILEPTAGACRRQCRDTVPQVLSISSFRSCTITTQEKSQPTGKSSIGRINFSDCNGGLPSRAPFLGQLLFDLSDRVSDGDVDHDFSQFFGRHM